MIVVKNSQLNNDVVAILNSLMDMDIKAGPAFKLMRIIKEISSLIEDKIKLEKSIIDKWAIKDEYGSYIPVIENEAIIPGTIKIKDINAFEEEMSDLLSVETTLYQNKIKFEDLCLNSSIKIKDLLKIDFIFE